MDTINGLRGLMTTAVMSVMMATPAMAADSPAASESVRRPLDLVLPANVLRAIAAEALVPQAGQAGQVSDGSAAVLVTANPPPPQARTVPAVPCGIAGMFWSLRHPAGLWRAIAPIGVGNSSQACAAATTGGATPGSTLQPIL